MASADEFAVALYSFEPDYEEGEESSTSVGDYPESDDEERFGRLITLDWCECSNWTTATHGDVCAVGKLLKHQH